MVEYFKTIFWRGVKVVLPLLITFAIVIWMFTIIEAFFGTIIKDIFGAQYYYRGTGLLLGVGLIFAAGAVINLWIVQGLYGLGERILQKIPVIKTIYNSMADLMGFFDPAKRSETGKPVLIETALGQVIGFVTIENTELLPADLQNNEKMAVYIPLSYQIGGLTVYISRDKVSELNMPVDKAMSFVLTAGMTGKKVIENESTPG